MAQLKVHNPAIINEQPKFWGEGFIERNLALHHSKLGVDKRSHRVLQRYKRLTEVVESFVGWACAAPVVQDF